MSRNKVRGREKEKSIIGDGVALAPTLHYILIRNKRNVENSSLFGLPVSSETPPIVVVIQNGHT